jgi:hypothetical protein
MPATLWSNWLNTTDSQFWILAQLGRHHISETPSTAAGGNGQPTNNDVAAKRWIFRLQKPYVTAIATSLAWSRRMSDTF